MNLGMSLIVGAFTASIVSAMFYFLASKEELQANRKAPVHKSGKFKNARYAFFVSIGLITIASLYFYYLIFTHQFQVKYIYQYSSRDLPFGFLLSTFWAGQEGSFLFWTLCISWLGLIFIKRAKRYENSGMVVVNLIQAIFLFILIKASPFSLYEGTIPSDGAGLNPLLQNFWMVIHPPILFVGYAAATFPFAIAMSAMIKKEYKDWVAHTFPWALAVSLTLGAGIIIGAFWSYETLGWGGYWGWDPVENSSLIPWLTTLALFHGLLVERRTGALKKTNIVLALTTFILVIYATFLTRSGVLADFSNHSFQDLGISKLLVLFLLLSVLSGLGLFLIRYKNIPVNTLDFSSVNKENVVFSGMLILIASATLTILGTSSPLITTWFGNPSQVNISFYNTVNLPVGIGMALLIGFVPFLRWKEKSVFKTLKKATLLLFISAIGMFPAFFLGMHSVEILIFFALTVFTILSNLVGFTACIKRGWKQIAAPLTHLGLGLMFIGIIVSGSLTQTERVLLIKNETKTVFEKKLTYLGIQTRPNEKNVVEIKVVDGAAVYLAHPRLYFNKNAEGTMREPDIQYGLLSDFYIAPLELRKTEVSADGSTLILKKEQSKYIYGFKVHFHAFRMQQDTVTNAFTIGADLNIESGTNAYQLTPSIRIGNSGRVSVPVKLRLESGTEIKILLASFNANTKEVVLKFEGFAASSGKKQENTEQLIVEVSKKPFMNVLWLGTILIISGTLIAFKTSKKNNTQTAGVV